MSEAEVYASRHRRRINSELSKIIVRWNVWAKCVVEELCVAVEEGAAGALEDEEEGDEEEAPGVGADAVGVEATGADGGEDGAPFTEGAGVTDILGVAPLNVTFLTTPYILSEKCRLPAVSMANPDGSFITAAVASPPSPLFGSIDAAIPVRATVDIMPVLAVTFRMRRLPESEMYMLPDASNTTFLGLYSLAAVARMSSPL